MCLRSLTSSIVFGGVVLRCFTTYSYMITDGAVMLPWPIVMQ
jgi:hypothetical protein